MKIELELYKGLLPFAQKELHNTLSTSGMTDVVNTATGIAFNYSGNLEAFTQLRIPTAAYVVLYYHIPRPKALLGHEHFTRLIESIKSVIEQHPAQYQTLSISAAGSHSSVMQRIKQDVAHALKLEVNDDAGDLLLRIRRAKPGWEVLIRTTSRPLATRNWRMYDMPGALNGSIAYAMAMLCDIKPDDLVLNLMCGSGTLLIESATYQQGLISPPIGFDFNPSALQGAEQNIKAANVPAELVCADVSRIPVGGSQANVILADLPFGQLVGSHAQNKMLYPAVLDTAWRLLKINGLFALITHEVRLINDVLATRQKEWDIVESLMVSQRGYHPRIFLLRKKRVNR